MRAYLKTNLATADAVLRFSFTDLYRYGAAEGAWLADRPLDADDGSDGDVTLCVVLPDDTFRAYEWVQDGASHRLSLVPAAALNRLDPPELFDHYFAGATRRELLRAIRKLEATGDASDLGNARNLRDAVQFFDVIGWLTPLRLREQGSGVGNEGKR